MWFVKRKSSNVEYYKEFHDFDSWIRVDLSELANAPFANPSGDPKVTHFKLFLEDQVKKGFPSMKTEESMIKRIPDVLDPKTIQPFQTMLWPPTNQVRQILVLHNFRDGSLEKMQLWVYDETTATAVIKFQDDCFCLYEKRDLL